MSIFDEIPNTDDFWVQIQGGANLESHFDVSTYLNARDVWLEKLKGEWIKLKEECADYIIDKHKLNKKLEALEEGLPNLTALDISVRDAEYLAKVLTVVRHEVRGLHRR